MPHIQVGPDMKMKVVSNSKSGHKHHKKTEKDHKISSLQEKLDDEFDEKERLQLQFEKFKGDRALYIQDLQAQLQAANRLAIEWRKEFHSSEQKNDELHRQLARRVSDLSLTERQVQQKEKELQQKDREVQQKERELQQKEKELQQREKEIRELRAETKTLKETNKAIRDEDSSLRDKISTTLDHTRIFRQENIIFKENEAKIMAEKRKVEKERDMLVGALRERERDLAYEKEARREDLRRAEEARREALRRDEARRGPRYEDRRTPPAYDYPRGY